MESMLQRIRQMGDRLPHAMILSGSQERLQVATLLAAAMECTAPTARPCLVCRDCRKVQNGIHPDVQTVQDEAHKFLPVERLRALTADAILRPNEGKRKVYLFPDCEQLEQRGQDILLKTVEEGPPYASFLFCTENAASLLPTLRSRCATWQLREADSLAPLSDASRDFCSALAEGQKALFTETLLRWEKYTREDLQALFTELWQLFIEAMAAQHTQKGREDALRLGQSLPATTLNQWVELMRESRQLCQKNVGTGLLLGSLLAKGEQLL